MHNLKEVCESTIKAVPQVFDTELRKNEMGFNFNIAFKEGQFARIDTTELLRFRQLLSNIKSLTQSLMIEIDTAICLEKQIRKEIEINSI